MKEYRYGMRLRPFGIGCQPSDGFLRAEDGDKDSGGRYWNIIVYSRPLTEYEIFSYDLTDLNKIKAVLI